jgi:hypothetical protein
MSTESNFVHINAFPQVLLAILVNEVTSAKELTAAVVTPPRACVNFTIIYIYICMYKWNWHTCVHV